MADAGVPGPGWRRWEPLFQSFTWPAALRMAAVAEVGPGQRVLDVGCGIGDPTLQVAVLAGPHGRVLGLDIAEPLVAVARERAALLGLARTEFRVADVTTAELPESGFDAVLARWSLTDIDDLPLVLAKLRRALAPGGRIALTGWAPPDANPWLAIPLEQIAKRIPVRALDVVHPGPFHCSADGALARLLVQVGFQQVDQERFPLSLAAPDADAYWALVSEMSGPVGPLLERLDAGALDAVRRDVATAIERWRTADGIRIPAQAQLAWGRA
jgi:ubiquinone/menaquinone biosynthesis C-methylase UbiE